MRNKRELILALAVLFLANILLIAAFSASARAESLRRGSSGDTVKQVQQRLKAWGYYSGSVDGIYGSKTEAAVRYFQQKNGLAADGVAGPKTLAAIGISAGSGGAQDRQVALLARLISAEARGEPYRGQVAVGAVVMNRIKHPSFPNTLSGVIYQPGAFSCLSDGQFDQPVSESSYRAARDALAGVDPSGRDQIHLLVAVAGLK